MSQPETTLRSHGTRIGQPHRIILLVGAPGTVSTSLIDAIEREFPWVLVEQCIEVSAAAAALSHPVSLILVDAAVLEQFEAIAPRIMSQHSRAVVALIEQSDRLPARTFSELSQSSHISGVLPMNVSLDVWLSVVRLMLCGGEYFPPHMLRSHIETNGTSRSGANGSAGRNLPIEHMDGLTPREVQILEMVARGLQNKSIAAAFSLSESTVKIHLHNIIAKLGVHNSTEAAARFRDRAPGNGRTTHDLAS